MNKGSSEEPNILICGAAKESMLFLKEFLEGKGKKVEVCPEPQNLGSMAGDLEPCLAVMMWLEGKPEWKEALKAFKPKKEANRRLLMVVTPSREALKAAQNLGADDIILYPLQKEELFFRLHSLQTQINLQQQLNLADDLTLQQTSALEARFYSMIGRLAHDLNTPLATAYMSCDLLKTQGWGGQNKVQQRTLEHISYSLGELKRALAAVGDWVRLMQGQLKPTLQPMQWQEVLEVKKEEWAELEAIARRDQKKILMEVPPKLPLFLADKELIGRTIMLLLYNSLHYTSKGDQIKIKVVEAQEGKNLTFCVEDTGQNIPATLSEMVFEWGISREEHLKGLRWGRGVGLNFCKQAVEACGGEIWAEGAEGQGCRFFLSLPLWQEPTGNKQKAEGSGQ